MGGETLKILAAKDRSYPVVFVEGPLTSGRYGNRNSVCKRKELNDGKTSGNVL